MRPRGISVRDGCGRMDSGATERNFHAHPVRSGPPLPEESMRRSVLASALFGSFALGPLASAAGTPDVEKAIAEGVRILVGCQEEGGAWPYQGVYGERDEKGNYVPPVGY